MNEVKSRSRLGLLTIIIAVIGLLLTAFEMIEIGLTIIFIAGLLMASEFIRSRLRKLTAQTWALGSIIVWIGFVIMSLPVIGFAWDIISSPLDVILFAAGLLMMIFGYTTEYLDLNQKLIQFWYKTKSRLRNITTKLREQVFRSIWALSAIVVLLVIISSYIFPIIQTGVELLSISIISGRQILFVLFGLLIIIEIRELIIFAINRIGNFFLIILNGLIRRIRHLPSLIKTLFVRLKEDLKKLYLGIIQLLRYFTTNTYVIGYVSAIILGIFAIIRSDSSLGSLFFGLIFISTTVLIHQEREMVSSGVARIQQTSYQTSFKARQFVKRSKTRNCPKCNAINSKTSSYCMSCQHAFSICMVCKDIIDGDQEASCPNCNNKAHLNHIRKWLEIKPECPYCKHNWKLNF